MHELLHCEDVVLDCNKKLDIFLEISQSIAGVMDPNDVLNSVIYELEKELDYVFPAVFLFNGDKSRLTIKKAGVNKTSQRILKKYFDSELEDISIPVSEGQNILIKAAVHNEVLSDKGIYSFVRPHLSAKKTKEFAEKLGVKAVVAVPLFLQGQTIGVLSALIKTERLSESEALLLQNLGSQISIAINDAKLFSQINHQVKDLEARQKDMEALLELSTLASSSLQEESLLQGLLDKVPEKFEHLGVVETTILLEDSASETLEYFASTQHNKADKYYKTPKMAWNETHQPVEKSEVLKTAFFEKEVVLFDDLHAAFPDTITQRYANKIKRAVKEQSYVAVPISRRDTVIGIVILSLANTPSGVNHRIEEVFRVLVNHIAIALENVDLYKEVQSQYKNVRRQQKALASANDALKVLDKTKSEFISIASHQLRTPLTVIKGYLALMLEGSLGKCDDIAMESIKKMATSTDRLVMLINDLLDISRIERGVLYLDREPVRLESIAKDIVTELMPEANNSDLMLIFHKPRRATPYTFVDRLKIREVMSNLVDNAIKYTPAGGAIDVYIKQKKDRVYFIVKDTGLGLSYNTIPKLFEKFSRGEGVSVIDTEGVGLGLFVAKKIIDVHDGKIWADSEGEGKGSIFEFSIPVIKK